MRGESRVGFGFAWRGTESRVSGLALHHETTAFRIVDLKDIRLDHRFASPQGHRVVGVARKVDGPSVEGPDQHTIAHSADFHGGCILDRSTGSTVRRATGVRNDVRFGNASTCGESHARKRERCAHDLDHMPDKS